MNETKQDRPSASGLAMPEGFDGVTYNVVLELVKPYMDINREAWSLFYSAWRGFSYRYRAAAESNLRFSQSVAKSVAPPIEERYEQDNSLYVFFSTALSSLECFYFGVHCLGAMALPAGFPLGDAKDLRFLPKGVSYNFMHYYSAELLAEELAECLTSREYVKLSGMRNVLSHRGSPPRHPKYGGTPIIQSHLPGNLTDLSGDWVFDLTVDASTTHSVFVWLEKWSRRLLLGSESFCKAHLRASA